VSTSLTRLFPGHPGLSWNFQRHAFETLDIDGSLAENGFIFGMKIIADDGDEIDVSEECGGNGKVCGGTTQGAFHFPVRAFECVIRD